MRRVCRRVYKRVQEGGVGTATPWSFISNLRGRGDCCYYWYDEGRGRLGGIRVMSSRIG